MKCLKKSISNIKLLVSFFALFISCKELSVKNEIIALYGKEINFKGNYQCYVKGKLIPDIADMNKDYKIVTYIDSTFCNSCSLKILEE